MKSALIGLLLALVLFACKNNQSINPAPDTPPQDTSKFYPLHAYLKEQIEYVDLRDFPMYAVVRTGDKKDSFACSKDQFLAMANVFTERVNSFTRAKTAFHESVFGDESTGSVTFNYQCTIPNASEVQSIDILLAQTTNIVKRVFIRSVYQHGDTTINEQCNWKTDKSFLQNRTFSTPNGYTSTQNIFVNWNDKP